MKRIAILIMVLVFCAVAFAESEWASYSDDELIAFRDELTDVLAGIEAELNSRSGASGTAVSSASWDTSVHHMVGVDYSIPKIEKTTSSGKNVVRMYVDWKNTGTDPQMFVFTNFSAKAYQNGKEVEDRYTSEGGTHTEYLPGYGALVFIDFENLDNSEMTIMISEAFNWDNPDKMTIIIDPKQL